AAVVAGVGVAVAASGTSAVAKGPAKKAAASMPAGCKAGGTPNLASAWGEPAGLAPWTTTGRNPDIFWQENVYSHLVELLPGSLRPQPGLAKSWNISKDGLTYTFHLRPAKFSDGSTMTAQDVKFSLDRMIDPKIQPTWNFLYVNIKGF